MAKVQATPDFSEEQAEQEIAQIEFEKLPMMVGIRGKIHKDVYRLVSAAVQKSGQDQGLFIEAGLRLFNNLPKEEKVKLLAEISASRMADSFE